jgi:hypothetical protein
MRLKREYTVDSFEIIDDLTSKSNKKVVCIGFAFFFSANQFSLHFSEHAICPGTGG